MRFIDLILQSIKLGLSFDANKKIIPYFWGCVGWLSVASAIVPSLVFAELIGGGVFFVFMTSLLIHEEGVQSELPSLTKMVRRLLDLTINGIISLILILVGLLLLVVPGVIASKRIIYSGVVIALGQAGPIKALKISKSLSMVNGYKLLSALMLMILISLVPTGLLLLPPLAEIQTQGGFGTILMILINLINSWFSYIVINHMIIISYKEAIAK